MRVSIVIPTFNAQALLPQTLRAVAAQGHADREVIVVDDGSNDQTVAIARASGARVLQQANAGVSTARNAGLAQSTGEFICFLDQDDLWHPEHLQRQLAAFARWPSAGAVVCPYQHWYPVEAPGEESPQWPDPVPLLREAEFSGWVYHQFMLDCWALTSATMIRREAVQAVGGFDAHRPYAEDWDLWLRLSREVEFVKLSWPPVLYRQHPVQGSRKSRPIDFRTELLLSNAAQHGLASRDGRHIGARQFQTTLARYEMEFGYLQLQQGRLGLARRALLSSWRRDPLRWRGLALALAGSLGWRPATVPAHRGQRLS